MLNLPLVSIVMPTYNGARNGKPYLRQAIESIITQTYSNFELIIVDDCSTDNTPIIIEEYLNRDSRIKMIRNPVNSKTPTSLNNGFAISRGDYLTWTADDNIYRENAIERMVNFLENNKEYDLVYTDYTQIDDEGKVYRIMKACDDYQYSLSFTCCITACNLYRRIIYTKIGNYNPDYFLAEDHEYWLRIARSFKLKCLHEDLYLYRIHGGAQTNTRGAELTKVIERIIFDNYKIERKMSYLKKYDVFEALADLAAIRKDINLSYFYRLKSRVFYRLELLNNIIGNCKKAK